MNRLKTMTACVSVCAATALFAGCGKEATFFDKVNSFGQYDSGAYTFELEAAGGEDGDFLGVYLDGEYSKSGFTANLSGNIKTEELTTEGKTLFTDIVCCDDKLYVNIAKLGSVAGTSLVQPDNAADYISLDVSGDKPTFEPDEAVDITDSLSVSEVTVDMQTVQKSLAELTDAAVIYFEETFGKADPPLTGVKDGEYYFQLNGDNFNVAVEAFKESLDNGAYDKFYETLEKVVADSNSDIDLSELAPDKVKAAVLQAKLEEADASSLDLYWGIKTDDGTDTMTLRMAADDTEITLDYTVTSKSVSIKAPESVVTLDEYLEGFKADDDEFSHLIGDGSSEDNSVSEGDAPMLMEDAREYVEYFDISYEELIEQLEYEGYTHEEAVYGADNCGADWMAEALDAAKYAASQEDYGFSYSGLFELLTDVCLFTEEQARHGVDNCGADWNEQAYKAALDCLGYIKEEPTRDELVETLVEQHGFTEEQAAYGVDEAFKVASAY